MRHTFLTCTALLLCAAGLPAQPNIQQGKIKRVDPEKMTLTLTVDGKDRELTVTEETRFLNVPGKDNKARLQNKDLKPGADVMFVAGRRDGKDVLRGLKLGTEPLQPPPPEKVDTSKFKPLPLLGTDKYKGFEGGLYPGSKNERPAAHEKAGLSLARKVQPLDGDGKPSKNGKVVLLSVGMSNTTQEFSAFKRLADGAKEKDPRLVLVDGAQGGMTAARIRDADDNGPGTRFWTTVDRRLRDAGVTRAQVQAAWIKEADAGPTQGFPGYARTLQRELGDVVRLMHARFPNLKLIYLSSRTYAGYARTRLNPEPYAYESGFSVKWLIEQQLKGEPALNFDPARGAVRAPWLSWGPYLWANGTTKNLDGLFYEESDFGRDGTHPSRSGQQKVAGQLLRFFKSDSTTKLWFVRQEK